MAAFQSHVYCLHPVEQSTGNTLCVSIAIMLANKPACTRLICSKRCLLQAGQYQRDVQTAINAAGMYFDGIRDANRSQNIVFDIDETALSNLPVS